ncbi:MAG: thioredoxin domain-containing protein [Chloracidobacterium sp.]|nr:thioredoxin domain-containing protein [Chloracidobacterium sp.]
MRSILLLMSIAAFVSGGTGQVRETPLATATGMTFTADALPEEARKLYQGQQAVISSERIRLLSDLIRETLAELEAAAQKSTAEAILAAETQKAAAPTEALIKSTYDANRAAFEGRTLDQVRFQIVAYLKSNSEENALKDLTERLKKSHGFAVGKSINAADLKPSDVIFTAGGKSVTAAQFDARFAPHIYDLRAEIIDHVRVDLENAVFLSLIQAEAKSRNKAASDVIAAEITDKLKDFTDEERARIENAFRSSLFTKYAVRILLADPEPVAHKVSADDDPAWGSPSAPVTMIMFSDFQCSACAGTHPILKKLINEYGAKLHFVVRDFPLESIHENAFRAALAANAARQQGKYFEYIDILYRNQDDLDAASLKRYAEELGLNVKQFELDLSDEKAASEVRKDMADGVKHGARGTPTIFINGVKVVRLSPDGFRAAIDRALKLSAGK